MKFSSIRVLHCPALVGGHPYELVQRERALGLKSWNAVLYPGTYGYHADEIISLADSGFLKYELRRWGLLVRALKDFDIIHFNFGRSILPIWVPEEMHADHSLLTRKAYQIYAKLFELRDLPLLQRAGKRIVVSYQGNDARQGDYCRSHFAISPAREAPEIYTHEWDARKRQRIARFAQHADLIYAYNPDLLHVLPPSTKFLPYCHLDIEKWKPLREKKGGGIPVVLHAPTARNIKGTSFVLNAIERLKQDGISFEFVLVEGVSREQARQLYERADIFVDQLLIGWYGGAAVELMALAKPVICYIREEDLRFIPQEMKNELPVINAAPDTIYEVLKKWLALSHDQLQKKGDQSRAYVEKWHDPLKIASTIKQDYENLFILKGDHS